jgi:hypothetical protein
MAVTRPYFLTINGVDRMVEAPNPAAAVRHCVGAAVTELRPARGAEVAAWVKAKKEIEEAGKRVADAPAAGGEVVYQGDGTAIADLKPGESGALAQPFLADDCIDWLTEQGATTRGLGMFGQIRSEQRMTLEQFDVLRTDCPAFAAAIVAAINGGDAAHEITVDEIRGQIEEQPFPLDVVVGAIADAKLYEASVAEAAPAAGTAHWPTDGSEAEFG